MKKVILSLVFMPFVATLSAQKLDPIYLDIVSRKFDLAKDKVTAMEATGKVAKNADFYQIKGATYDSIANNPKFSGLVPDASEIALEAYKKAVSINPKQTDLANSKYWPFFSAYLAYENKANNFYNAKKFCEAAEAFKKGGELGTYIAKNKWEYVYKDADGKDAVLKTNIDDNDNIFNTALCYYNCGKKDEANNYHQRLVDKKAKLKDYENSVYFSVINYHVEKGNTDLADKYTAIAKEVFPEVTFFDDPSLDQYRKVKNFEKLFAQYDKILSKDPNNLYILKNYVIEKNNYVYEGVDIAANKLPVDYEDRVANAKAINEKAIAATTDNAFFLYLNGQLHNNLGYDLVNKAKEIKSGVDPKTKKMKPLAPELAKKRDGIKKAADDAFGTALNNLLEAEKKYNVTKSAGKFEKKDKQPFSNCLNLLSQIYSYKAQVDKTKEYEAKYRAALNN